MPCLCEKWVQRNVLLGTIWIQRYPLIVIEVIILNEWSCPTDYGTILFVVTGHLMIYNELNLCGYMDQPVDDSYVSLSPFSPPSLLPSFLPSFLAPSRNLSLFPFTHTCYCVVVIGHKGTILPMEL